MKSEDKTKEQLISELAQLRQEVAELEKSETGYLRLQKMSRKLCKHLEELGERLTGELSPANEQLKLKIRERKLLEERLVVIIDYFQNFGTDPFENINRLTALCGKFMGATCALYNRLDGGMLYSWGQWNTPADYNPADKPDGHICYDVIKRAADQILVVSNLPETRYAQTDPNVILYKLQTYIGRAVKSDGAYVGSLCVVYQDDFVPSEADKRVIDIIASAIAVEEERRRAEEALRKAHDELERRVEERTAELLRANQQLKREIVEREQAENCLRESEERLRAIFQKAQDSIFIKDRSLKYSQVNPAMERLFDLPTSKLVGLTDEDLFGEEAGSYIKKVDSRVLAGEIIEEEHTKLVRGVPRTFHVIKVPIHEKSGEIVGLCGIARDITERKKAKEALQKARDELERRVEKRTAELVELNEKLKQEIEERKQAEHELRKREAELKIQTNELEEVNTALRVLLKSRDEDKGELEEKVLFNVKELVLPYSERLKKSKLDTKQTAYLSILESNLHDIVSPFARKLSSRYLGLTSTEIHIANLVKEGKATKEIAELLNLSTRTVESHRQNIRKKLGIRRRKANLRSHLLAIQ